MRFSPDQRRLLAGGLVVLGLLVATLALSYAHLWQREAPAGGIVTVDAVVLDRHGHPLFDGSVTPPEASVLSAVEAAAEAGGFDLDVNRTSSGSFIVGVNGTAATEDHPWAHRVLRDGTWCWGNQAASDHPVRTGDGVGLERVAAGDAGGCHAAEG